jgi:hypothetical protein
MGCHTVRYTSGITKRMANTENILHMPSIGWQGLRIYFRCDL